MDDKVFALIERALQKSHVDKSRERLETIARLRAESDRLQQRLDRVYIDQLDGRITAEMHDRMVSTWREERARCQRQVEILHNAEDAYVDDGIALLDVARKAHQLFTSQPPAAKNSALNLLVSNSSWANGELTVTFCEPFGMLEEFPLGGPSSEPVKGSGKSDCPTWLPGPDSNQRPFD